MGDLLLGSLYGLAYITSHISPARIGVMFQMVRDTGAILSMGHLSQSVFLIVRTSIPKVPTSRDTQSCPLGLFVAPHGLVTYEPKSHSVCPTVPSQPDVHGDACTENDSNKSC